MKAITTNLLNRFWKKGITPMKEELKNKIDTNKIVASTKISEAGKVMDGKTASEEFARVNDAYGYVGKTSVFRSSAAYNVNSSPTVDGGTAWGITVFNSLGVEYVPDWTTYKHGFRVPFAGVYKIEVSIPFTSAGFPTDTVLYGYLNQNGVRNIGIAKLANNYLCCTYSFIIQAAAKDLFTFTLLQNSGTTVVMDATSSRFIITYLGKE